MKIKAIIFDMDGVLWKEDTPLTNLKSLFHQINSAGIRYAFATNNSTKTPHEYQKKFAEFGAAVHSDQVITSGTNLAAVLRETFPNGGPLYIIGESGLVEILKTAGFSRQETGVLAVVGGLDRTLTYAHLKQATLLINQGIPFYFTNPDPSFPSPAGNIPGAGAIMLAIEAAAGVKAITPGKPEPFMFLNALKVLKSIPQETLVVGDRLDTDILGGLRAGCKTALVLSGVTSQEEINPSAIKPDLIYPDVTHLINSLIQLNWELPDG